MQKSVKEPVFIYSEDDVRAKSPLATAFLSKRAEGNVAINQADDPLIKRFYNVDHNAYLEGHLPAKYKELMGLTGSLVLRCDDCVFYHVIQAYRLGVKREEISESLNIGMVIGGTITIPHLRRAYQLLAELYQN